MHRKCQGCDYVPVRALKLSKIYCVLKAYFDESYDSRTLCVGGWLCDENTWKRIEDKWLQRIEYERRISIKRGHEPIQRYHATDCSNLKREFRTWTVERQIQFTKKLIGILGAARPLPIGIAVGISLEELKVARPELKENELRWVAYFLCICECFNNIGQAMDEVFPTERVTVLYEVSEFDMAPLAAFQQMYEAKRFPYAHYFVSVAPGRWQDFPALQPADLIAFEGFKLTAAHKRGKDDLRKSLQKVIGHGIVIRAGFYRKHGLKELSGA